jgi:hypothetical protein
MRVEIPFDILAQPDDSSCGPTCLHAVYRHYGDEVPLDELLHSVPRVDSGGTLGVLLGSHALERGYESVVYTFNLQVFDPTWFALEPLPLRAKLEARRGHVRDPATRAAAQAYMRYVELGGQVRCQDLTAALIRRYLKKGQPMLAGLSATYLYGTPRELGEPMRYDDVHGEPQGHFVVLCGYDAHERQVVVADPLRPNPLSHGPRYRVSIDRLVCAMMLGVLTYDANLLIVRPSPSESSARPLRRRSPL